VAVVDLALVAVRLEVVAAAATPAAFMRLLPAKLSPVLSGRREARAWQAVLVLVAVRPVSGRLCRPRVAAGANPAQAAIQAAAVWVPGASLTWAPAAVLPALQVTFRAAPDQRPPWAAAVGVALKVLQAPGLFLAAAAAAAERLLLAVLVPAVKSM